MHARTNTATQSLLPSQRAPALCLTFPLAPAFSSLAGIFMHTNTVEKCTGTHKYTTPLPFKIPAHIHPQSTGALRFVKATAGP